MNGGSGLGGGIGGAGAPPGATAPKLRRVSPKIITPSTVPAVRIEPSTVIIIRMMNPGTLLCPGKMTPTISGSPFLSMFVIASAASAARTPRRGRRVIGDPLAGGEYLRASVVDRTYSRKGRPRQTAERSAFGWIRIIPSLSPPCYESPSCYEFVLRKPRMAAPCGRLSTSGALSYNG